MLPWKAPNDLKTIPMGILHDNMSCWSTLGPFRYPRGPQNGTRRRPPALWAGIQDFQNKDANIYKLYSISKYISFDKSRYPTWWLWSAQRDEKESVSRVEADEKDGKSKRQSWQQTSSGWQLGSSKTQRQCLHQIRLVQWHRDFLDKAKETQRQSQQHTLSGWELKDTKTKRHKDSVCITFHQVGSETQRLSIPTAGWVQGNIAGRSWTTACPCWREDENSRNQ